VCSAQLGRSDCWLPRPPLDATSLWLWDSAAGGVGVNPRPLLDRSRGRRRYQPEDVPAADRHPMPPQRSEKSHQGSGSGRADALGASERMLQLAVDYSKQRNISANRSARSRQSNTRIAQMLVTVESSFPSSATPRNRLKKVWLNARPMQP